MDATSITSSTLVLTQTSNGAVVAAAIRYDGPSTSAIVTPNVPLSGNTSYTLTARGGASSPVVKDASGNALAANYVFSFTTGTDGPLFGNANMGTSVDDGDANYMSGSRFVTPATVRPLAGMAVYLRSVSQNQFQMAIYTDNNGSPGSLVAHTGSGTTVANSWNKLAITATLSPNTAYWLVYNTNDGAANMSFDAGAANQGAFSNPTGFGTWPATFGSATKNTAMFSIYAF